VSYIDVRNEWSPGLKMGPRWVGVMRQMGQQIYHTGRGSLSATSALQHYPFWKRVLGCSGSNTRIRF